MQTVLLRAVSAALLTCATGAAVAVPITYAFSGIITDLYPDNGKVVNGSFTFDPSALTIWLTDGVTYSAATAKYWPPYPRPTQIRGSASDGVFSVSVGGGAEHDEADTNVSKNANGSGFDDYAIGIYSFDASGNYTGLFLETYAFTDGVHPSGIFDNTSYANPDLSPVQHVNWNSPGSGNLGTVWAWNGTYESFAITSVTVTAVPEASSLALLATGLAAVASYGLARRRRQHAMRASDRW